MHNQASEDTLRVQREQFAKWRLDMQETTVPYHRILTWPSQEHWNTITEKRKDLGTISEPVQDSPETAATKARLRNDRVSFSFQGSPFKDVVNFIGTAKGLNLYVANEVAGELESVQINLTLNDVTVEHALKTLNKVAGNLTFVVQGSVVYITKPELARADPIIKVHSVGDLTVQLTNFIAGNLLLLPANAEEKEDQPRFDTAREGTPSFGGIEELIELVKKNTASEEYWGTEGVNIAASGTDKMLVVAEPEVQRAVARFLEDLRVFSGLVVTIETRFLTVTDRFLRDVGVDIRGLGNASPGPLALLDDVTNGLDDNASAGFDNNGPGLPANGSGHPSSGAFFNNGSDGDYRAHNEHVFDRALGSKITNTGGAVIQWSLVDDTSISMILRAVEKTQEGRLLQAPSVTVYNTQRANITLINQLTYIQDFDVEVAQTAFIADPIIGIIQDGLVLDVQPTVSHDRKYITLTLRPTIANLVRPIPTFTTSLGAFTTPVTIQVPELRVERAATTVRVPDGGTLLMGGLKTINMADMKAETPWLSSIPFAAFFLGRKGTVKEMDNLMVIVKASISDLQEEEAALRR
jgi:type II secretory pathway component GspD/PulD (secretin)